MSPRGAFGFSKKRAKILRTFETRFSGADLCAPWNGRLDCLPDLRPIKYLPWSDTTLSCLFQQYVQARSVKPVCSTNRKRMLTKCDENAIYYQHIYRVGVVKRRIWTVTRLASR